MPNNNMQSSYDRTVDIVRHAIPRMSELKIPITPSNYAVWYEYLAESNAALREEMDALLEGGRPITDSEMRALYERYLEERSEKLQAAKSALSQVVAALMNQIQHADGHYSGLSTELEDIAQSLAGETSAEDVDSLMERALRATRAALEHGADMRRKLSSLANQMEDVKSRLADSQQAARQDALTKINNRLAFQEALDTLHTDARDDTHAPCLLVIDIDFFKRVNDTYGHQAGDQVLACVAQDIKASVRGRDLVARYGGEEFVVLLRDTPRTGCMAVAENVRKQIERAEIYLGDSGSLSVSVSIGGAWFREAEAVEAFVERADRALYQSKQDGRNRVTWESRRTEN